MKCIRCGSQRHEIKSVQHSERMNEFGRLELGIIVESVDIVTYDPMDRLFHCKKCGGSFTFQEYAKA